jgi:CubicO group peptidase (beta-lactamase class C family)
MSSGSRHLSVAFALLLAAATGGQALTPAAAVSDPYRSLRLSEPVDSIAADLAQFVPEYVFARRTPGAAIALIRDGEIAWTRGYGLANAWTKRRVTPETLFEIASNGKVVTAYIALRLVDQGLLSLDQPLNDYLSEPWLPESEHRDAVTLRHVLSHTSGLGASANVSRGLLFPPGQHYYYSGIGFMYLQKVIEEVTGKPVEVVARELVFTPLGMSSSSYVKEAALAPRTANGHLHAAIPAVLFVIPFVIALVVVGILGLIVMRVLTGRWRPTPRVVVTGCAVAFALSLVPAWAVFRPLGMLEFVWLIGLVGFALVGVFVMAFLAHRIVMLRVSPERSGGRVGLTILTIALTLVGVVALVFRVGNLPVPKWPATVANGAGSMRATAADMAAFLLELADPQLLDPATGRDLRTPQVRLSEGLSWGLGAGIQHSPEGDALWQWGQHFDFQSVMIIYPARRFGVVVCTNSDLLDPDVALEIAHRALGGDVEPMRRALHLEFNYRGGG